MEIFFPYTTCERKITISKKVIRKKKSSWKAEILGRFDDSQLIINWYETLKFPCNKDLGRCRLVYILVYTIVDK